MNSNDSNDSLNICDLCLIIPRTKTDINLHEYMSESNLVIFNSVLLQSACKQRQAEQRDGKLQGKER